MEKISVIVPIYNVEPYLKRCINSITNQTYKNLEILLVDDGSTDNCGKICDEYAKEDNRIKVIHKENGGLSDARNNGLLHASGKYVTFIDSDDYVTDDYVEYLYNTLKLNNCKMSICSLKKVFDSGKIIDESYKYEKVLTSKETLEKMLYAEGIGCSTWAKMYDISLFENVKFPYGRNYEEIATTYKLIDQCDNIACGLFPKYYYAIRKESITQGKFSKKKFLLIDTTNEMCDYIQEKYPDLKKAILRRRLYANISIYRQLLEDNSNEYEKEKKEIRKLLMKHGNLVIKDKRAPKRDRIALVLIKFGESVFKISWGFYNKLKK